MTAKRGWEEWLTRVKQTGWFRTLIYAPAGSTSAPAIRWTIGRRIAAAIGAILLGFFFLVLYGMLHPNLALDAARDARDAVARQLKDADSAEYRNIDVFRLHSGGLLVCGEVNARNSFGAMTGYTRFIGPGGTVAIIEPTSGDRAFFDDLWESWGCTGGKGDLIKHDVTLLG